MHSCAFAIAPASSNAWLPHGRDGHPGSGGGNGTAVDGQQRARWSVRTDLAVEAHRQAARRRAVDGVEVEERRTGSITVQSVTIADAAAGARIGKAPGRYVTIHSGELRTRSRSHGKEVARELGAELARVLALGPDTSVLLVGLGNWNATPDALGPRVIERVLVTRHLGEAVPAELAGRLRPVAAVAPGVLGLTGMETGEIVRGIVREVAPERVVCIDSLAAQDPDRLCTTIQVADSGIRPGSGVGNHRAALTRETLGVPTIAVGVPTVVHAIAIVESSLGMVTEAFRGRGRWAELIGAFGDDDEDRAFLRRILDPKLGALMVTPKEIDLLVHEVAWVIAGALNGVLHPGIDLSDFGEYAQ
jgi:spore protease